MEDVFAVVGAVVVVVLIVFFLILLYPFMGALAGYIVGLVFGDTILGILGQMGLHGITMWQLGAFLGFVGGFFKTSVTQKKASS